MYAVCWDHVRHLLPVVLGSPATRHDGGIRVVAALVDVRFVSVVLGLALIAGVFSGRPYVTVRDVAGLAGLGEGVHPVVVFVEDLDALSLAYGEFFVATGHVVADGRHAEVGRAVPRGLAEHLPLEGPVVRGVAGLVAALVAALVAGGVRRTAVVAGGAGAVLVVLDVAVSAVREVVGRGVVVGVGVMVGMSVETVPVAVGIHGSGCERRCGAGLAHDGLLQLLGHGYVADLTGHDLVEHLHSRRQYKVSLAVLACGVGSKNKHYDKYYYEIKREVVVIQYRITDTEHRTQTVTVCMQAADLSSLNGAGRVPGISENVPCR